MVEIGNKWIENLFSRNKKTNNYIDASDDAESIQFKTLGYLRTHRTFYVRGNFRCGWLWNVLNFLVIFLSSLSAILAAIALKDRELIPAWALIVLPALSAFLSTFLLQFRIRDLWQLRDEGRIQTELLICEAHLIPTENRQAALEAAMKIRTAAIKLELDQSHRFFSVIGNSSPMNPQDSSMKGN